MPHSTCTTPLSSKLSLCVLALLMGLGYASFHVLPIVDPPQALGHVAGSCGLYLLFLLAAWLSRDLERSTLLVGLVLCGVAFRLILLPLDPSMSDDLYRYIWDGKMQAIGMNPYALAPKAPYLAIWRDSHIHPLINHEYLRTLYPPVSEALFWVAYKLHPNGYLGLKVLLLGAELTTLSLLAVWLRRQGLPMGRLLWYAWCPLPILELMLDGHLDGFGPPLLLATLLAAKARRPWLTGILYALGLLVKPLGLFVGPLLLWQFRWRGFLKLAIASACIIAMVNAPYLEASKMLVEQILHYSQHWYFNGPLFIVLDQWFVTSVTRPTLALTVFLFAWLVPFLRGLTFEQRFLLPLTMYMLTTPTLYPWYIVWIAPWLVLAPRVWLFWLVGAILLAHTVQHTFVTTGKWAITAPVFAVEFLPLLLLMLWAAWQHFRRHRGAWVWVTR